MFGQFDFDVIQRSWVYLFTTGMAFTLKLTVMAMAGGILLGTMLALMRLSRIGIVSTAAGIYVNGIRAVPLVLVIFWFYFLVPYLGAWLIGSEQPVKVGAFTSSLVTFIMFEAAYYCEIMRAGIQSIPRGQVAAGQAIGLTHAQTMIHIVLPQAFRNMVPVLLTQSIILFQDVSLVYVLSITDFVGAASKVAQRDGRMVEMYVFVALVYFVMSFTLSLLVKRLEKNHGDGELTNLDIRQTLKKSPPREHRHERHAHPMIEMRNVSKNYGNFQVLTDCSVKIQKGEVVVVCGPSGSGKSTLIKTVNGLEPFQKGEIFVDGISVGDPSTNLPKLRSRIGMVFQNFELFPHMSVTRNITLGQIKALGRSAEDAHDRALKYLDRVGLLAHKDKFPGQLSGGQQQRVAIARALSMDPLAMLFDEPTSALDPEMITEVLDVMVDLAQEGKGMTMIVVTHEMGFARKVADRVVFMDMGRIVEDCTKAEFFTTRRSERAQSFLQKIIH